MKFLSNYLIIVFCIGVVFSQNQKQIEVENKQILILDQTTSEEAVKMFGAPSENKIDRLKIQKIDQWFTAKYNEKIFNVLSFKKVENFEKVELSFLEDKLVLIHYVLDKRLSAHDLSAIYKITFLPVLDKLSASALADYENHRISVSVANFPKIYYLLAITEADFIFARISNDQADPEPTESLGDKRRDNPKRLRNATVSFMGKVTDIEIISRKLGI